MTMHKRRIAVAFHESALAHDTGPQHPERAERCLAILQGIDEAHLDVERLTFDKAKEEDLCLVHTREHVARVRRACARAPMYLDPDTPVSAASWEAALYAVGAACAAVDAVLQGKVDAVFSLMRPPGHHAEPDAAMGFCLFNNIAIAARHALLRHGLDRVAVLDWDVHHGNGTQAAFYDDEQVYYASIHQHPLYPGTGWPHERGKNNTNLNIPMPPGADGAQWLAAVEENILPEFEKFRPQLVLISCGFDAHRLDPLAQQNLDSETFGAMTRRVLPLTHGKIVSVLEGGYNLSALKTSAVEHLRALQGYP